MGVTLYLWCSGSVPFDAPTTMLLMREIASAPERTAGPASASAGLRAVIEGLLTRDPATRLTLVQMRLHPWLTNQGKAPLPLQPVLQVEVSPEEIAQAFTNRQAIAVGSASGPSALGKALSLASSSDGSSGGWTREGPSTIRKSSTAAEARFYRAIGASGHLAPHIPIIYSITAADGEEEMMSRPPRLSTVHSVGSGGEDSQGLVGRPISPETSAVTAATEQSEVLAMSEDDVDGRPHDILMQDMASSMARPCAMAFILGTRTVAPSDFRADDPATTCCAAMLEAMRTVDAAAPTPEEEAAGGISQRRYLDFLDRASSTATLGVRLDAAKTVVEGALDILPLPEGVASLATVREESQLQAAIAEWLQHDMALAGAFLLKLQSLNSALERSTFFPQHAFVRTTMLLVYDDAARLEKLELKIMNFAASYTLPEGTTVTHTAPWDGSEQDHEDGYMVGMQTLLRVMAALQQASSK